VLTYSHTIPGNSWADRVKGIKPNGQQVPSGEHVGSSNQVSSSLSGSSVVSSVPNQNVGDLDG